MALNIYKNNPINAVTIWNQRQFYTVLNLYYFVKVIFATISYFVAREKLLYFLLSCYRIKRQRNILLMLLCYFVNFLLMLLYFFLLIS